MKTKRLLFLVVLVFGLVGCAHFIDPAGPLNKREMFPRHNQDPRRGVVINDGTMYIEFWLKDQADRIIEHGYMAGAGRFLVINGQYLPHYWIRQLDIGSYTLEFIPFYFQTDITNVLFGLPIRYRRKLMKQTTSITVGRDPTAYYDYRLGEHFGWITTINGGYIPDTATSIIPGIKLNVQGNFR